MTISSSVRVAGPYTGTGSVSTYPFSFKVFQASDVLVKQTDLNGNITTLALTTNYSVSLSNDQNANPGGSVNLNSPLPNGYQLVISSQVQELQGTSLTNNGGFYPAVIENALDYLTILTQQAQTEINASLQVPLGGTAYTAANKRISNVADATDPQDVPSLVQTQTLVASAASGIVPSLIVRFTDLIASGGSALVSFIQAGTGAIVRTIQQELRGRVYAEQFGAVADWNGTTGTDNTTAITNALAQANAIGVPLRFGPGSFATGLLTLPAHSRLIGAGVEKTTLVLKSGANTSLLQSSSFATEALLGTNTLGDAGIIIERLTLDGNAANNTSSGDLVGVGIGIYGERPILRDVYIKNTAGHGMLTDGPSSGSPAGDYFSMEGHFERIVIDSPQKHGWYFNGPHDSTALHVIVVDASHAATNTWDSLYANASARWVSFHGWTRSLGKRHRHALNAVAGASGSQFLGCHFEGTETSNVQLAASNCQFDDACNYYSAFGTYNIFLSGTCAGNTIKGYVGPVGSGAAAGVGVAISNNAGDSVAGNVIDLTMSQQQNSNIFFGAGDKGSNTIRINAYQTAGSRYSGTPSSSDVIDITLWGGTNTGFTNDRPVAWVTFDGTVATPTIASAFNVASVTKTGTGRYTVNFANNIPTNATMLGSSNGVTAVGRPYSNTAAAQDVVCNNFSSVATDAAAISLTFYAN